MYPRPGSKKHHQQLRFKNDDDDDKQQEKQRTTYENDYNNTTIDTLESVHTPRKQTLAPLPPNPLVAHILNTCEWLSNHTPSAIDLLHALQTGNAIKIANIINGSLNCGVCKTKSQVHTTNNNDSIESVFPIASLFSIPCSNSSPMTSVLSIALSPLSMQSCSEVLYHLKPLIAFHLSPHSSSCSAAICSLCLRKAWRLQSPILSSNIDANRLLSFLTGWLTASTLLRCPVHQCEKVVDVEINDRGKQWPVIDNYNNAYPYNNIISYSEQPLSSPPYIETKQEPEPLQQHQQQQRLLKQELQQEQVDSQCQENNRKKPSFATTTPIVNTPIVNTPIVNTPLVNTPIVNTPLVNTPLVNTPRIDDIPPVVKPEPEPEQRVEVVEEVEYYDDDNEYDDDYEEP
jgi:hypothetical protein